MRWLNPKRLVEGGGQGPQAEQMRALLERLSSEEPAPPIAESALRARIWSRLEAGERRSYLEPRWLAGGVAALAILLICAIALRAKAPSRVDALEENPQARGETIASPIGPASRASVVSGEIFSSTNQLGAGAMLLAGSEIHTARSRALVRVSGYANLLLQPGTSIRVDGVEELTRVHLSQGEMLAAVKMDLREQLAIELGESAQAITVRGDNALFSIRVAAASAFISVSRGSVLVEQGALAYRIAQGHSWSSAAPAAVGPDTIRASDRDLIEPAPAAVANPAAVPSAKPVLEEKKQTPTQKRRGAEEGRDADSKMVEPVAGKISAPVSQGSAQKTPVEIAPPGAQVAIADLASASASDPCRDAEKLLAQNQPGLAAQGFAAIVEEHGVHRDLALYELGRVRQRDLHDPAGALQAFRTYQRDYPNGALAQEVALSLIDLELGNSSSQDRAAALDGITSFLADHPKSERAAEMHLLRGNLLRERGECERAIADYAQAIGPFAGDALYFTAFCQRTLGRAADAKSSLLHYLAQFPSGGHRAEAEAALDANQ